MVSTMSVRFKRLLAAAIDWYLSGLPALAYALFLRMIEPQPVHLILFAVFVIGFPVCFVFRDRLFKGRSPGKRLLGLTIIDRRTCAAPSHNQLVTKNIFFPLSAIDWILLLVTGQSLGEQATKTAVVPLANVPEDPSVFSQSRQKTSPVKMILVLLLATVLFIGCLYGIISAAMKATKDTPEYQIAYAYLLESNALTASGVEASQIHYTGYSSRTSLSNAENIHASETVFTFVVGGRQYQVVCHPVGNTWTVCTECTQFH